MLFRASNVPSAKVAGVGVGVCNSRGVMMSSFEKAPTVCLVYEDIQGQ